MISVYNQKDGGEEGGVNSSTSPTNQVSAERFGSSKDSGGRKEKTLPVIKTADAAVNMIATVTNDSHKSLWTPVEMEVAEEGGRAVQCSAVRCSRGVLHS